MDNNLMWHKVNETGGIEAGFTREAFDYFGQLWAVVPVSDRKRNFIEGEQILSLEGSDALGCITIPFGCKRVTFKGDALDRPDELCESDVVFVAEAL